MKLNKNIEIINKGLFLIKEKILVIADLHIGFEQVFLENGIFIPKTNYEKMKKELETIFDKVGKINKIIILGDLKHKFGFISKQEWKESLAILEFMKKRCKEIILIKGNHDSALEYILKKEKITIKDYYIFKEFAFFHGHKIWSELYDKNIKIWIIGHKHPTIIIRKYAKQEKYKCFLVGKFKDKQIIILPSFFPLLEGSDITIEDTNLAFNPDLSNYEVYAIDDEGEIYYLKKLKNLK